MARTEGLSRVARRRGTKGVLGRRAARLAWAKAHKKSKV